MTNPLPFATLPLLNGRATGNVELPPDAVTQGFALLARRRSGKSNAAGVIEETLSARGDPWVCLDPVSAHWGIRYLDDHGRPGKPSGNEVLIVGGKYGDVPLDEKGGAALAQILVDTDISCVVDLGGTSMNARQKYVAEFAIELLRINETPRFVLLEEADEFVPQQLIWDNQKFVRGALTRLIKQGGGLGIGYGLISQRPASVAKDVLEQVDNLIVLRMSGPNDLKAVQSWFEHNIGDVATMKEILASLPGFKPGEAWLCCPEWTGTMLRAQVRERTTYHAGRTPKRGDAPVTVKRAELGKVIEQFRAAAAQRHIAVQDERDLKAENVRLNRELAAARKATPSPAATVKPCDHEREIKRLTKETAAKGAELDDAEARLAIARISVDEYAAQFARLARELRSPRRPVVPVLAPQTLAEKRNRPEAPLREQSAPKTSPKATSSRDSQSPAGDLTGPEQRILNALAWWEAIGVEAPAKSNVGFIAGYRVGKSVGGTFGNLLGSLRSRGLLDYPQSGCAALTEAGRALAQPPDTMPTTEALHEAIAARLQGPERRVLEVVIRAYPESLTKQEAGAEAGYQVGPSVGGTFGNILGRLRSLGLIDYPGPGRVAATQLLFPEAA